MRRRAQTCWRCVRKGANLEGHWSSGCNLRGKQSNLLQGCDPWACHFWGDPQPLLCSIDFPVELKKRYIHVAGENIQATADSTCLCRMKRGGPPMDLAGLILVPERSKHHYGGRCQIKCEKRPFFCPTVGNSEALPCFGGKG